MSELSRDTLKWLQSLDLTWPIRNLKWDLTNGFLTAEIFSWYYPTEIEMHMYYNGGSLDLKQRNWYLLKNFFKRHKFEIPDDFIEGTIHCKEGAAQLFLNAVYENLTNRKIQRVPRVQEEIDFTDRAYQMQLPMHARSTGSKAVKNNINNTELMADKSIIYAQQKAHHILSEHVEQRRQDRILDPQRFECKPTLGEKCLRRAPSDGLSDMHAAEERQSRIQSAQDREQSPEGQIRTASKSPTREASVAFKEVSVQQLSRPSIYQQTPPVTGY